MEYDLEKKMVDANTAHTRARIFADVCKGAMFLGLGVAALMLASAF